MSDPTPNPSGIPLPAALLKLAAVDLVVAVLGLPINDLFAYLLLLLAVILIVVAPVSRRPRRWAAAMIVATVALAVNLLLPAPAIEEGHNVFRGDDSNPALRAELPPAVYAAMQAQFGRQYPPEHWCDPAETGCWRKVPPPPRAFAFSADGLLQSPAYSRRVTKIDFSDAIALRLGVFNDRSVNWYTPPFSDVSRAVRDRRSYMIFGRWKATLPYFVMYRIPPAFIGGALCWHGTVLWEEADGAFSDLTSAATRCRSIAPDTAGRRIFGVSIDRNTPLAMRLQPPAGLAIADAARSAFAVLAVGALLALLTGWRRAHVAPALALTGISLLNVVVVDVTMLGRFRPLDGGGDGITHYGFGRVIAQALRNGDWFEALRGAENVYYFVPGLRYFRAAEQFLFGDTFLGYLGVMLALPFLVFFLFRRFVGTRTALLVLVLFAVMPVTTLFGSSYVQYLRWVAPGYPDPLGYAALIAGLLLLIARDAPSKTSAATAACGGALLFAAALWVRPNLAPFMAVFLTGCGLAALYGRRIGRAAALCLGFAPVFLMTLHNWVYGGKFYLFGENVAIPANLPVPPATYADAARELPRLDLTGGHISRVGRQLFAWLSGSAQLAVTLPLNLAALVILLRVALFGRNFDPWLRLVALATLAEHGVGLFYVVIDRYHLATWLLTLLVVVAWLRQEGLGWFDRAWPGTRARLAQVPPIARASRALDRLTRWVERRGTAGAGSAG